MDYKSIYKVLDASFLYSAPNIKAIKKGEAREVSLIGRSNVGKSTLLNALCLKKSIAKTSKTPGRTQAINFFNLSYLKEGESKDNKKNLVFSDLPGFGFAKVSQKIKNNWQTLIENYLFNRENLYLILLLVDCRRAPREEEKWLANLGSSGNLIVVMTKTDKLSKNQLNKQKMLISRELQVDFSRIYQTSLVGKQKGFGVSELRDSIIEKISR